MVVLAPRWAPNLKRFSQSMLNHSQVRVDIMLRKSDDFFKDF